MWLVCSSDSVPCSLRGVGSLYLQRLEGVGVGVAVQDDVVGHAEALSDAQVVEERGLAERIRHLHDSNVWW